MGILTNALGIACGGLLGGKLKKGISRENNRILGIGIMIISLVGFFENIYLVTGGTIASDNLLVVLFTYMIGSRLGEWMGLEEKMKRWSKAECQERSALLEAILFFGVGGLQICGPIALAVNRDNSQLLLKSAIDLPFAIALGATYGRVVALSAVPVALGQGLIAVAAFLSASLFSSQLIAELCAMGYIILFFSGYNLITEKKNQISNTNMLPGIALLILYHLILSVW